VTWTPENVTWKFNFGIWEQNQTFTYCISLQVVYNIYQLQNILSLVSYCGERLDFLPNVLSVYIIEREGQLIKQKRSIKTWYNYSTNKATALLKKSPRFKVMNLLKPTFYQCLRGIYELTVIIASCDDVSPHQSTVHHYYSYKVKILSSLYLFIFLKIECKLMYSAGISFIFVLLQGSIHTTVTLHCRQPLYSILLKVSSPTFLHFEILKIFLRLCLSEWGGGSSNIRFKLVKLGKFC